MKIILLVTLAACGSPKDGAPGPAGPAGAAGAVGATGAAGAPGTSLAITSSTTCSITDAVINYVFFYNVKTFTDGSLYADCSVQGAAFGVSGSSFFAADENGAKDGYCAVNLDIDAPSFGEWRFTLSPGPQALYSDLSSSDNNTGETFTNCTTTH